MLQFNGDFENKFAESYMRNHKAVTVKNLRCFPRCSPEHKDNGFCGNEVVVRWATHARQCGPELETYSEFQEADKSPRYFVNQEVLERDLYGEPALMRGEVVESDANNGSLHFSRESKGWHYGWMAGRGNGSHALHEMRVFLFERLDSEKFICRLVMRSSPFQVTSRKRIRPKKNPSASSASSSPATADNETKQRKRGRKSDGEDSSSSPLDKQARSLSTGKGKKGSTPPPQVVEPEPIPLQAPFMMSGIITPPAINAATQAFRTMPSFLPEARTETAQQGEIPPPPLPSASVNTSQQQQPPARPTTGRMDKPAAPPFSRSRQPPVFMSSSTENKTGETSSQSLPPPSHPRQYQQQPPRQSSLPANPQNSSSQFTSQGTQGASRSLGVSWPFYSGISSTPPIYQHPSTTPPIYQHGLSTTPPIFNFPMLFGSDQSNNIFSNLFQGQAPFDHEVLDVLMQPTPPNTYAALQHMYRQQQNQQNQHQAYLQQKEEKEKQARSSVGTMGTM